MLSETLRSISTQWPSAASSGASGREIERAIFQVSLIQQRVPAPATIIDLGAGMGMFPLAAVKSGYTFYAVDDYKDPINAIVGDAALNILRSHGVNIIEQDILSAPLPFSPNSADAVTIIGAMEHLHHSPKNLFRQCAEILKPGGVFMIGGPNSANLRKRVMAPFGKISWSRMADWYEQERFRGHVREPNIDDYRYIARDLGLVNPEFHGRNYMGEVNQPLLASVADKVLRRFPSLCSDIYMVASKP